MRSIEASYDKGLIIEEIRGYWAPYSCLLSPWREQMSIMSPHQYKKFNRDLVFVFNESEVASSINHFDGIAPKPNCVVEVGGLHFEHAPHLVYSLRLYADAEDAAFPYGQLLLDYGDSFLASGAWSTNYDAERGPFPADAVGAFGLDSTLYVDYWDAIRLQSLTAEKEVHVISDESGPDEGDEDEGFLDEAERWNEDPIAWMECCECYISEELTHFLETYLQTNEPVTKRVVRQWYAEHPNVKSGSWCEIGKHLAFSVKWATRLVDEHNAKKEKKEKAKTPAKRKTIGGKEPRSAAKNSATPEAKKNLTPNIKREGSATPKPKKTKKTTKTRKKQQEYYL